VRKAGKWAWGALNAAGTIQFAAWFGGLIVAVVAAGLASLPVGFRVLLFVASFGFVTCLLMALTPLLPARIRQKPKSPKADLSPNARANLLQDRHNKEQAEAEAQEHALAVRRAIRQVREELLDNRRRVQRAGDGDLDEVHQLTAREWELNEGVLLELADSEPHSAARQAYRDLQGIENTQCTRDPENPRVSTRRDIPAELLETDVEVTIEAIDDAVQKLSAAEAAAG
jgi:hypothetical protein